MFLVRQWDASLEPYAYTTSGLPGATGIIGKFVFERNFDPQTLTSTIAVNGTAYSAFIAYGAFGTNGIPSFAKAMEFLVDPLVQQNGAVADNFLSFPVSLQWQDEGGSFYTGLTYDDAGGVRFLLNTNNLNVESLLPDVHAATNGAMVNTAPRPGVDKITFVRQLRDPSTGFFQPLTNEFIDTFVTNGQVLHQELKRVIGQPDFLFSAEDTGTQSLW